MTDRLTGPEIERYGRQISLSAIGGAGQARLRGASLLLIGAGGIGAPALLYLAAAGIGRIGIVDDDVVDLSNLQRQIAFRTEDIGKPKVQTAAVAAEAINPLVRIESHALRLTAAAAPALVRGYDLVCDGSDNEATRYAVADACLAEGRTLIAAAVTGFAGQIATLKPHAGADFPCYRCLIPAPDMLATGGDCAAEGVLGPAAGVMGSLLATEAIKEILGIGTSLAGRLLLWDALDGRFQDYAAPRDPACSCARHRPALPLVASGAAAP